MQALGPDLFNGNAPSLTSFRTATGVPFPLLLNGALGSGNENLFIPYGDRDSYAVISKQGIVRYSAYLLWPYGNRYHVGELRGCIDSLVTSPLDVGSGPGASGYSLRAAPNPFHGETTLELSNPERTARPATVTAHDLAGRRIATPWQGEIPPGTKRLTWDGRDEQGARVRPGLYLLRSDVGGVRCSLRVVILR